MDWQPIATLTDARIGHNTLVWCPEIRCTFSVSPAGNGVFYLFGGDKDTPLRQVPTHWMPVPDPPDLP